MSIAYFHHYNLFFIKMTALLIVTTLALTLLTIQTFALTDKGIYDASAQKGWESFVDGAAKGTGGTPIKIDEFVTRLNNNVKTGDLVEAGDSSVEEDSKALLGPVLAPAIAPMSGGAFSITFVGVINGLLPIFVAYFVL